MERDVLAINSRSASEATRWPWRVGGPSRSVPSASRSQVRDRVPLSCDSRGDLWGAFLVVLIAACCARRIAARKF